MSRLRVIALLYLAGGVGLIWWGSDWKVVAGVLAMFCSLTTVDKLNARGVR